MWLIRWLPGVNPVDDEADMAVLQFRRQHADFSGQTAQSDWLQDMIENSGVHERS